MPTAATDTAPSRPRPLTVVTVLVIALVPFALLRRALRPVDDPDAFWHVLSGQNIWRTGDVVVVDPFSAFSTNTWVQLDWLSDLVMAAAHAVGGYAAVAWLYTVLAILLFVALYTAARAHAAPVAAALVAVLGWIGTYASQGFRPQTVSFVLLALTLIVWTRVADGRSVRTPWWLVGLSYVWACLHGLWILGPLIGAAVVVGLAVDRARPSGDLLRLAAVPVASVAVAALTPVGPRLLLTPFTVNSYAGLVSEWRPPDIHEPYVAAAVILLAVTVVGWARSTTRAPSPELLLWLMALGFTLLYSRTVAVGAIIAVPLAARSLATLLPVPDDPLGRRLERVLVPGGAIAAAVVAALLAPTLASGTSGMPSALARDLDRLPAGTVVLNDDAVGGWLLLEHPDLAPVIDTRTYLFDVPYIEAYMRARAVRGDWQDFVRATGATTAVLRDNDPLATALIESLGWVESGRGDGFLLLTTPEAAG